MLTVIKSEAFIECLIFFVTALHCIIFIFRKVMYSYLPAINSAKTYSMFNYNNNNNLFPLCYKLRFKDFVATCNVINDFYSNKVVVSHKATCLSVYDCWDPLKIMLFNTICIFFSVVYTMTFNTNKIIN